MVSELVLPGDRLSTEEEFIPQDGTFTEKGSIYAYLFGEEEIKDGAVNVIPKEKDVKTFKSGMYAIGEITDDLRTVMFVKLSNIENGHIVYVALKSGKYVAPKPQFDRRGGFHGRDDRGRGGDRGGGRDMGRPPREEKPFKVGDIVVAKIVGEDKDTYSLGISAPECGVVYSNCELCGNMLKYNAEHRNLVCDSCKNRESKKVSTLYNDFKGVEKLFKDMKEYEAMR